MAGPYTTTDIRKHGNVLVTSGAIYTNPSTTDKDIITALMFHNTSNATVTIECWLVSSGGSTSITNKFFRKDLFAGQTYTWDNLPLILAPGDFISATAGTSSVVSVFLFGSSVGPVV